MLTAGLFLCSLYALHDMQTAEGIGLYFAIKLGMSSRIFMDVLVDALCMLCFVLLIWLPCRFVARSGKFAVSYCRLLIGYLAVVPSFSLSAVMYMFQGENDFLWDGKMVSGFLQWFADSTEGLQIWLPLLIVLYAVRGNCGGRKHKAVWGLQDLLLLLTLAVPALKPLTGYLVSYLGLLLAFDCWETVFDENEKLEKWSLIWFALLMLRGIYRMLILVSRL